MSSTLIESHPGYTHYFSSFYMKSWDEEVGIQWDGGRGDEWEERRRGRERERGERERENDRAKRRRNFTLIV